MDYLYFGLMFVIGFVASRLVFGGRVGEFEKQLMHNLSLGKRVVIAVDDECFIYEMYGNRVRITKGITMLEDPYELESNSLGNSDSNKSSDDNEISD